MISTIAITLLIIALIVVWFYYGVKSYTDPNHMNEVARHFYEQNQEREKQERLDNDNHE